MEKNEIIKPLFFDLQLKVTDYFGKQLGSILREDMAVCKYGYQSIKTQIKDWLNELKDKTLQDIFQDNPFSLRGNYFGNLLQEINDKAFDFDGRKEIRIYLGFKVLDNQESLKDKTPNSIIKPILLTNKAEFLTSIPQEFIDTLVKQTITDLVNGFIDKCDIDELIKLFTNKKEN